MTIDIEKAKAICKKTVEFFRSNREDGGGSTNQVYTESAIKLEERFMDSVATILQDKMPLPLTDPEEREKAKEARDTVYRTLDAFLTFKQYRTSNAGTALDNLEDQRTALKGRTILQYGESILNSGNRFGNCTENACVAAWLASKDHSVSVDEIFMLGVDKPADHAFCYIGPRPTFKTVGDKGIGSQGWIIDPWADVFAPADTYRTVMVEATQMWLRQGMRLGQVNENEKKMAGPNPLARRFG